MMTIPWAAISISFSRDILFCSRVMVVTAVPLALHPPPVIIERVALLDRQPAIIGRVDDDMLFAQRAVAHAREDPRVDVLGLAVASDHGWQRVVVTVVHNLKQLLARPRRSVLSP